MNAADGVAHQKLSVLEFTQALGNDF